MYLSQSLAAYTKLDVGSDQRLKRVGNDVVTPVSSPSRRRPQFSVKYMHEASERATRWPNLCPGPDCLIKERARCRRAEWMDSPVLPVPTSDVAWLPHNSALKAQIPEIRHQCSREQSANRQTSGPAGRLRSFVPTIMVGSGLPGW